MDIYYSIILWGLTKVIEEEGSPPILDDNTRGNGYNMHKGPTNFGRRDGNFLFFLLDYDKLFSEKVVC